MITGSIVLLPHGFPEIWYSWHHQMIALVDAGLHAISPVFKGYGLSNQPSQIEKGNSVDLAENMAGLLDTFGIQKEHGRALSEFGRFDAETMVKNIYTIFSGIELAVAEEGKEIMDLYNSATPLPSWFTEDDHNTYSILYEKSGFSFPTQVPYITMMRYIALLVVSFVCYIATFAFSGLLFYWFNPSGNDCSLNIFFICICTHCIES
ncbi:uncharacterized protein LOC131051226 isoform X1 [Cryptomeria japonica]|uniref:uncharacterized protein LOC131051226 isoform X1 n=1 Tax=Cryptomeria japonica TaxID=3369 RepID=UPI0027D9DFE7|nr:uncharacterized protein LOC131051226 isoform X1 [Cryptomeria japonica]